nr:MAG TPA: hypothetical protein [Caudoviricetes sp.]
MILQVRSLKQSAKRLTLTFSTHRGRIKNENHRDSKENLCL